MAWTRSEEKWDQETTKPTNRDNDGRRFGEQLFRSHFDVGPETRVISPSCRWTKDNDYDSYYEGGE